MKIEKRKLSTLKSPEKNVRRHTDKQIEEFVRSIKMFGQIRPIVIDEDGVILAGNGLKEALEKTGATEGDCYVAKGLTEAEKKKLMLADNRIFNLGIDDIAAFDAIIADLGEDFDIPGYDEDFLKSLVMDAEEAAEAISEYGTLDEEEIEPIRKAEAEEHQRPDAPSITPAPSSGEAATPEQTAETRRSVICPNCGETIWL